MEETLTIKDRLKGHGKWLGGLFVGLVFTRLFDPVIDWATGSLIWLTNSTNTWFGNGIYRGSTQVYSNSFDLLLLIIPAFSLYILTSLPDVHDRFERMMKAACVIFIGYGLLFSSCFLIITSLVSEHIQVKTLQQLDVIKPYTSEYDSLYSQFLLVQTKDDYFKVWGEIMAIAQRENVVLPAFEKLNK
ncbi:hypothetical protein VCRA2110O318_40048 [Vibrio crassostreae]|nr:hypothetical protein VCRA2117O328_40048 [Vibrio crassostreae]CAK2335129.1 hypothetical protein VCRA2110O318_40048 [Vibrio crassostreae]CAK2503516.1 hypothetical protein VCRA2110O319_50048 [Vibrio crassostreae]CAK2910994.1 hypothetical protein VCRA217O317_30245 [Vibrio crassostreae]